MPDKPSPHDQQSSRERSLDVSPARVPVFNCVVYIGKCEEGIRARVGNMPGLECTARDERTALTRLVSDFKKAIAAQLQEGGLKLLDPPPPPTEGEETRLIPVHL